MTSHQGAKRLAAAHLRAQGSALAVASATRDRRWPAWVVSYLDPASPDAVLVGGALVVTDDGVVHDVGSAPGSVDLLMLGLGAELPWRDD